jgi:hypothetical protein
MEFYIRNQLDSVKKHEAATVKAADVRPKDDPKEAEVEMNDKKKTE